MNEALCHEWSLFLILQEVIQLHVLHDDVLQLGRDRCQRRQRRQRRGGALEARKTAHRALSGDWNVKRSRSRRVSLAEWDLDCVDEWFWHLRRSFFFFGGKKVLSRFAKRKAVADYELKLGFAICACAERYDHHSVGSNKTSVIQPNCTLASEAKLDFWSFAFLSFKSETA